MELNKALKVEVAKDFDANVNALYNAWTNPEELKQWWKPMGNSLKEVINDVKEGGTARYIFNRDTLVISGQYQEVKENEKLVYTWNWELPNDAVRNAEYKLTINFKSIDNGSEIKVLQENFQDEETMLPHQQGWEKGLDDLNHFLSGGNSTESKQSADKTAVPETGGYREDPAQVKVGGG